MRVFDCTIYSGEVELLKARLSYLDDFIDCFIIIEAIQNFSGLYREIDENLREEIDKSFPGKIRWEILCFPNFLKTPWEREAYQRNHLEILLANNHVTDLILLSDLDEIPSVSFIETSKLRYPNISIAEQLHYQYCIHSKNRNNWYGTVAFNVLNRRLTPQELRMKSVKYWENVDSIVTEGGWHFSSFGSFQDKVQKFSHQELNTWPYTKNWFFILMRNFGVSVLGNQEIDWVSDEPLPFQIPCRYRHSIFGRKLFTPLMKVAFRLVFRFRVKELSMPNHF